jgi:fatty-acyl-CoA synthase
MLSYSRGHDAPLIDASIWEVFEKTASRFPDKEALVARHQGVRLTFSELAAVVERTARGLTGLGLGAQDRMGCGRRTAPSGYRCIWPARGSARCW